jgi:hypothetical protein
MQNMSLKMNVQAEKFKLIEWLVQLQDLEVIQRIQALKNAAEVAEYEASLKPMSVEELVARAEESNEDIKAGRVYTREEVESSLGL